MIRMVLCTAATLLCGQLKVTVQGGSEQGKPLAGATIILMRNATESDTVKADAIGQYIFADLLPVSYTVKVWAEGFQWINRLPDYVNVTVYPRYTNSQRIVLWPNSREAMSPWI